MSKFELNVNLDVSKFSEKVQAHYDARIRKGIVKALQVLLEELKRITPEDTKKMLNSYEVEDIERVGTTYIGKISNDAPYAIYVEFGAGRTFTYHKPKGVPFYKGVGNRTFARAMDNKKKEMLQIVTNSIRG